MYKKLRFLTTMLLLAVCCGTWAQTANVGDNLWLEEFKGGTGATVFEATSTWSNSTNLHTTMLVSEDASSLTYTSSNAMANNGTASNMNGAHVWLNKNTTGYISVSGIPLYNASKVKISWAQAGSSKVSVSYAFDGETTFTELSSNSSAAQEFMSDELIVEGHTTINLKFQRTSTKTNVRIDNLKLQVTEVISSELTASDLNLANAPVSLNFDLYNNSNAQTISYTTSSTGAVTVSGGDGYVTTSVNATNKSITVTPIAVTPSAQTITVNQAADETYAAGSVTFTVSIADSTPIPTYTVTLGDDNTTLTEETGNAGVVLPTRNAIGEYTFAGWSVTNVTTETTEAPTIVAAGTYHPTANVTLYPVYTRSEGSSTTTTESVTISEYASTNNWENGTQYDTVVIDDNVTATASDGTNTGKYYTNGKDWRFYQNEDAMVTIALTQNGTLNSVKFDFTVNNSGTLNYEGHVVESGTAVNVSGNTAEFTVGNSGTVTNGQVRISAIEVNYTIGNGTTYYWSNPGATVSISSAGYATYVAADNVYFPAEVTAYIVSDVTASSIKLTEVLAVAKDVPVVVKGTAGTYDLEVVTADDCDDVTENKLLVSDGTVSDNILVLANKSNGVGFYTWAGGNLPAGKVYLVNPNSSREFFGFDEGVATSISTIDNGQWTMDNAYNLQGQKVGSEYKGIIIVNGKKFINK